MAVGEPVHPLLNLFVGREKQFGSPDSLVHSQERFSGILLLELPIYSRKGLWILH